MGDQWESTRPGAAQLGAGDQSSGQPKADQLTILPSPRYILVEVLNSGSNWRKSRPNSSNQIMSITKITASPGPIAKMEPFLPIGDRILQELGKEFRHEAATYNFGV